MSNSYHFGDIGGPVNTGSPVNQGGNQVVGIGSIHIAGGSRNSSGPDPAVFDALECLRKQLDGLRLTGSERNAAAEDLAQVKTAGEDKAAAAIAFESFLGRLESAHSLAQMGTEFAEAVGRIASWIGPLAAGALALLQGH